MAELNAARAIREARAERDLHLTGTNEPREALRRLAEELGESLSDERLAEIMPQVERLIHARPRERIDLGETEPAFGLRFDGGA